MNAAAAQPGLGDRESFPLAAEDVLGRYPDVGVADVIGAASLLVSEAALATLAALAATPARRGGVAAEAVAAEVSV